MAIRCLNKGPNKRLHADAQTYALFVVSLRSIYHKKLSGLGAGEPGVRAKMNKIVPVLLFPILQSCANSLIAFDKGGWDETAVSKQVFQKAGENAIDCGFHNLLTTDGQKSIKIGFECVRRATLQNKNFMFGTYRIPIDSYAMEILIGAPSGEYWTIVYDRMLDEGESQLWLYTCKSVKFHKSQLSYEGKQCNEKTSADWL